MNNAFRRGFDGWVYVCHGFNNETTVAGTDGHTIKMQSGNTYRMRLDGSRVEQFTWGQVNPFGMAIDPLGNLFTADCHSKPIYQLLRGGYYPSFGKPHDGLGFVPPMMDHTHGSTAICGLVFYAGANFPPEYHGNTFSGNVMTSRVNRNSLVYHGSTILAHEEPDFLSTTDPWFRPVDLRMGPDGALYVADFYNRIIGHYEVPLDHPGRDRSRARIWRIVYKGNDPATKPAVLPPDLGKASIAQLIAALDDRNQTYSQLALDQLTDRIGSDAVEPVRAAFSESQQPRLRSNALWALYRLDGLNEAVLGSAAGDPSRDVRVHAMKVLSEVANWSDRQRALALAGLRDADPFAVRAAADALGRHPQLENVRPLLDLLPKIPDQDNHLRSTVRMAIRDQLLGETGFAGLQAANLSEADAGAIAGVALAIRSPEAASFLLRHVVKSGETGAALTEALQHIARYIPESEVDALARFARMRFPQEVDLQVNLLNSIQAGLQQRGAAGGRALQEWGAELARQLLDSVAADPGAWANTPVAGKPKLDNPWVLQKRLSADGDDASLFICSLPKGEALTGSLRSRTFKIPAKLSFYAAGHIGFPGQPIVAKNFIRLRAAETDEVLMEATPPRNDTAQRIEWNLEKSAGKQGYLEILDGDDANAYAWLAVGRFEPQVVPLPPLNPSQIAERQQAAAGLAAQFKLAELKPRLAQLLLAESTDLSARAALARALVALEPDSRSAALAPLLGDPALPAGLREKLARGIVSRELMELQALLAEAVRVIPQRLQMPFAESLAGDPAGAEVLLQLVQDGHASPRLLLRRTVREKLLALKLDKVEQRIEALTAKLPSENEALLKLIAARQKAYAPGKGSAAKGAAVFAKNCAACHQIDGQGPLVGPQLDGIGNRGLERLLEDVLDPNRNIDVAFRSTTLVLDNGLVVTGLFRREEGATLVLVDNKGKEFTVPKAKVEERIPSQMSLMPENLAEAVPEEEFQHLLAFLLSKTAQPKSPPATK
jgi:putative heme-binding domain-containing protein